MNKRTLSVCGAAMFLSMLVSSAFGYEKEIEELSAKMAEKIADKGKKRIAVADFADLEGVVSYFDKFIAEQFTVALSSAGKNFRVIDRSNLNSILKEYKLSQTGIIDQDTVRQLGKIAGVDALVTGTMTPFGDNVQLIVKVLDADTADVIDSAKISIARTEAVNELMRKEIAYAASTESGEAKKAEAKSTQEKGTADGGSFSDDFNAGPKPDWKPINGNWTMSNGQYTVTDINKRETYTTFIDGRTWSNFAMEVDVSPGYIAGECAMNICPRMISSQETICFGMSGSRHKFKEAYWFIIKDGSNGEAASKVSLETSEGKPVHVKIEVKNGVFTAYVNGTQTNQIYDTTFSAGSIGLGQWYQYWDGDKIRITFDNLEIKPLAD